MLDFLLELVIAIWPFGDKRWWKLSVVLIVAIVTAVTIGVTMSK